MVKSEIPPHVAQRYREVIGKIIVAKEPLSIPTISRLLGMTEDAVLDILKPISPIVDLSNNAPTFYNATVKEFIAGKPQGNEEDKMFFIDDRSPPSITHPEASQ